MEQYTIYCTESQTKKALELGATMKGDMSTTLNHLFDKKIGWFKIPTAEQMIGWLEGHEEIDEIAPIKTEGVWIYVIFMDHKHPDIECPDGTSYPSRPEATLAAIDAALDYLIKTRRNSHDTTRS